MPDEPQGVDGCDGSPLLVEQQDVSDDAVRVGPGDPGVAVPGGCGVAEEPHPACVDGQDQAVAGVLDQAGHHELRAEVEEDGMDPQAVRWCLRSRREFDAGPEAVAS